jgi:hypothetical protein
LSTTLAYSTPASTLRFAAMLAVMIGVSSSTAKGSEAELLRVRRMVGKSRSLKAELVKEREGGEVRMPWF